MSNSEIAVDVREMSKQYKLFSKPSEQVWYYLFKLGKPHNFTALDSITFSIRKGETFGIIGKNGSGKSTALQILAGIIKPTTGSVYLSGKVAALLELGSGFNAEATGLENIYMNAAILGVGKKEIKKKINEIIDFADIGEFISQPVKKYSSGMYVRLAFSVAINVEAEILLIDEALAVGDIFFRQKCYSRLNQLKQEGKTIILVTHGMGEVEQFCDRALLLHYGKQISLGRSQDIVKQYYLINQEGMNVSVSDSSDDDQRISELYEGTETRSLSGWSIKEHVYFDLSCSKEVSNGRARLVKAGLFDKDGMVARIFQQGDDAYFYFQFELLDDISVPIIGVVLYDQRNIIIYGKSSAQTYAQVPTNVKKGQHLTVCQKVALKIAEGEVTFEFGISDMDIDVYKNRSFLSNDDIFAKERRICHQNNIGFFSVVSKKIGTPTRMTHHGVCDLPTEITLSVE